jgi:hypothetical protein
VKTNKKVITNNTIEKIVSAKFPFDLYSINSGFGGYMSYSSITLVKLQKVEGLLNYFSQIDNKNEFSFLTISFN